MLGGENPELVCTVLYFIFWKRWDGAAVSSLHGKFPCASGRHPVLIKVWPPNRVNQGPADLISNFLRPIHSSLFNLLRCFRRSYVFPCVYLF